MKHNDYWRKRFLELEAAQNQLAQRSRQEIERHYRQTQRELDEQIRVWYQRLEDNNEISLAEARRWLTGQELAEFKWDVQEYIKRGTENAIDGRWAKQLENASARFHISRLEALKIRTQQSLEELFAKQQGIVGQTLGEVYRSGYYHTAFELQKGFAVGWDIAAIDQRQLEKVLAKPWAADGKNFSARIWGSRDKLVNELHTELTRNIMLGQDPQKAIDALAHKMQASKTNAGRLVMTEEAYFSSLAQRDCFAELGVEQFEIVATLDSHTSEICQELDGVVRPMSEFEPGVTAPPFHVNCRSTTVPYFDDEFSLGGERAARGEDGQTYYVPADMTYRDWEKSFVGDGNKNGLQEVSGSGIIKRNLIANGAVGVHYVGKINREIFSCISSNIATDEVIITDERVAHIRERHPGDYERYVGYLTQIVEAPDYILAANKPNSALLLKSFEENGKNYKLILRFVTTTEDVNYKNSVITFQKVETRRYVRYTKSDKVLYKRE